MEQEQKPTIGRIVHFVDGERKHRAAIVNEVSEEKAGHIGVTVMWASSDLVKVYNDQDSPKLRPDATEYYADVPYSVEGGNFSWHWPERE